MMGERISEIQRNFRLMLHEQKEIDTLSDKFSHKLIEFYYQKYFLNNRINYIFSSASNSSSLIDSLEFWNPNEIDVNVNVLIEKTNKTFTSKEILVFCSFFETLKNNVNYVLNIIKNVNKADKNNFIFILITSIFSSFSHLNDVSILTNLIVQGLSRGIFNNSITDDVFSLFLHILFNCTHGVSIFRKAAVTNIFTLVASQNATFYNSEDANNQTNLNQHDTIKTIINIFNLFVDELESLIELIPIPISELFKFIKSRGLFARDCHNPLFFIIWKFSLMPTKQFSGVFGIPCSMGNNQTKFNLNETFTIFNQFITLNRNELIHKYGWDNVNQIHFESINQIETALSKLSGNKEYSLPEFNSQISSVFVISESQLFQIINFVYESDLNDREFKDLMQQIDGAIQKVKPRENKIKKIIVKNGKNKNNIFVFKRMNDKRRKSFESYKKTTKKQMNDLIHPNQNLLDFTFSDDLWKNDFQMPDLQWEANFSLQQNTTNIYNNDNILDNFFDNFNLENNPQTQNSIYPTEKSDNNLLDFISDMPIKVSPPPTPRQNRKSDYQNKFKLFSNLNHYSENGKYEFNLNEMSKKISNTCCMLETNSPTTSFPLENSLKLHTISADLEDDMSSFSQCYETLRILLLTNRNNLSLIENLNEISRLNEEYFSLLTQEKRQFVEDMHFINKMNKINLKLVENCDKTIMFLIFAWYINKNSEAFQRLTTDFLSSEKQNKLEIISSYTEKFKYLSNHKIFKNLPARFENLTVHIPEQIIFEQIYSIVMSPPFIPVADYEQFQNKIDLLVDEDILAPELKEINEYPWHLAQRELVLINCHKNPRDKIKCISKMVKIITSLLMMGNQQASADVVFPAIIYVICKANPPYLFANCDFIAKYSSLQELSGEDNYCWVQFSVAISYIKNNLIK